MATAGVMPDADQLPPGVVTIVAAARLSRLECLMAAGGIEAVLEEMEREAERRNR